MERMSSFERYAPSSASLPGTKMSPKGMQLLTSSGNPSIDHFIGGGFPLTSVVLLGKFNNSHKSKYLDLIFVLFLEEDESNFHWQLIVKSFIADGIEKGHKIVFSSPRTMSTQSRLFKVPSLSSF